MIKICIYTFFTSLINFILGYKMFWREKKFKEKVGNKVSMKMKINCITTF